MRSPERWHDFGEEFVATPVQGGHMNYERLLIASEDADIQFAKCHDATRFSDPIRERHSREYLAKEHMIMEHLRHQQYDHIPAHSRLIDDHTLLMEGLSSSNGWHWRAPDGESSYVQDVLSALETLEGVAPPSSFLDSHGPSHAVLRDTGWPQLDEQQLALVKANLHKTAPHLHTRLRSDAHQLADTLESLRGSAPSDTQALWFCHHDLRQANLAWHPQHGVRIVDWSWAGMGLEKADSTSLLVDLHKSGHDIEPYRETHFNPEHAHLTLGYLLARSIAPGGDSSSVRFHQTASAVSTFSLLHGSSS